MQILKHRLRAQLGFKPSFRLQIGAFVLRTVSAVYTVILQPIETLGIGEGQQAFPVKDRVVNVLGFMGTVFASPAQLCSCSTKGAIGSPGMETDAVDPEYCGRWELHVISHVVRHSFLFFCFFSPSST